MVLIDETVAPTDDTEGDGNGVDRLPFADRFEESGANGQDSALHVRQPLPAAFTARKITLQSRKTAIEDIATAHPHELELSADSAHGRVIVKMFREPLQGVGPHESACVGQNDNVTAHLTQAGIDQMDVAALRNLDDLDQPPIE